MAYFGSSQGRSAGDSFSVRRPDSWQSTGDTRVHTPGVSPYEDYEDLWSDERNKHDASVRKTTTKYGALMALTAILGYFGFAKGGIASLFSKWFGGKDSDYDDIVNYNLGEDDPDGELAKLLSNFQSDSDWSWLTNVLGKNNSSFSFSGLLPGLFNTLGGFVSQLGNSWLNMENMNKLIDKQNAYNTPKAQMERFADAGLNPNLVYGLGSNGNQPSSGSIAPVDFDTSKRENRLAKFSMDLQSKQFMVDMQLKQAQARMLNSQSGLMDSQQQGQNISNDINSATAETQKSSILQGLTNQISQNELIIEQKKKVIAETNNQWIKNKYEDDIQRLTKENLDLHNAYQSIQNEWQPWINGFDLFNKGATGLGSLGISLNTLANFKNIGNMKDFRQQMLNKKGTNMSPSEFYDMFSNYGFGN